MTQKAKTNDGTKVTLNLAQVKSVLMAQSDFLQPVVQEAVSDPGSGDGRVLAGRDMNAAKAGWATGAVFTGDG